MADIESNININVNTGEAISHLKALQRQISAFHTSMAKTGAAGAAVSQNMAQNLINQVNAGGKFLAEMKKIRTTTDAFNDALEKNKFTMKEYFRYAGASTKTFGKLFKSEFDTINKVARENVKTLQTQYIKMGRDASGALKAISLRPLALDMNDYATKTAMAAQRQALLNQLLKQGSTSLLNFGKNTQWAGRQLMVGFTIPLMYFGSVASKTFMELEEQAIRFKRVYGDMFTTTADTTKALKDVQMLANEFTKYGVAVADTMKMAADVAATGKMGADLMAQVAQASKLAVLGGIDQQKSLDTLISLTSTFGIASEDLAQNIDFLNAVENQTILNIDDLTTAIPKAAPVIKQLGGDVQDLAFFMTAMREGGIQAGEGANALKSGLASIINPTKRASEFLSGMGINIKAIVDANKGDVKQLVLELATALDELEPLKRAQAIEQLFGKFQFARISTLFQNVIKEGTQAQTVAELTKATTEELAVLSERELKKIEESPMFKFKKQVQDLKTAIAPVGAEFLKALTPVIEFFGKVFDKFNNLSDGAKQFITYMTALLAGLGPIAIMSFGLLANGVANIIKGFTAIKGVFNRAGQSSTQLGEQTNYLTQSQMQAAAVAASLDQTHMKLTQSFTSEKQALDSLVASYRQAIAAQNAFSLAGPRKNPKPPMKLAEGIVSVPGSGTGDKVPAMLSPGEAVIPSAMAKKYAPLINGMIANNIPGYIKGRPLNVRGMTFSSTDDNVIKLIQKTLDLQSEIANIDDLLIRALEEVGVNLENGVYKVTKSMMIKAQKKIDDVTEGGYKQLMATGLVQKGPANFGLIASHGDKGIQISQAQRTEMLKELEKRKDVNPAILEAFRGNKPMSVKSNLVFGMPAAFNKGLMTGEQSADFMNSPVGQKGFMRYLIQEHNVRPGSKEEQGLMQIQKNIESSLRKLGKTVVDDSKFYEIIKLEMTQALSSSASDSTRAAGKLLEKSANTFSTIQADITKKDKGNKQRGGDRGQVSKDLVGMRIPGTNAVLSNKSYASPEQRKQIRKELSSDADKFVINSVRERIRKIFGILESTIKDELGIKSPSTKMKQIGKDFARGAVLGFEDQVDDAKLAGQKLGNSVTQGVYASQSATSLYGKSTGITAIDKSIRRQNEKIAKQQRGVAVPPTPSNPKGNMGQRISGGLGSASMVASMAASMGAMAPGKIGDISQKLMMPLMAMSFILPMLNSKFGALAVGVGAIVGLYVQQRMAMDKARDAAIDLALQTQASSKSIQGLSEFAGRVSASELMSRRRSEGIKQYQNATGKTTFGESFVAGEKGQALTKAVGKNIAVSGAAGAGAGLTNQLATAVTSGALTAQEARSIALNIGDQLGNQQFGIKVSGQLERLLGPNGENLVKDPLKVRVQLVEQSNKGLAQSFRAAGAATRFTGKDTKSLLGNVAAGAGAGTAIGATAGSIIPGIGTAIGAGVGGTIGAIAGGVRGLTERKARVSAAAGGTTALAAISLQQNQQMLDGLQVEYEKRIEIAKAAGDTAKSERLQNEYIASRQSLLDKQQETSKLIEENFKNNPALQGAMQSSADKMATKAYEDTMFADVVPLAQDAIAASSGDKFAKIRLTMEMANKNIDPGTMISLLDTFGKNKEQMNAVMNIVTKFGGASAARIDQISSLFLNDKGEVDEEARKKFLMNVEAASTAEEAQKILDFNEQLTMSGGELDIAYLVNYYENNPEAKKDLMKVYDGIKENKGKLEYDVLTTFMPPEYIGAIDKEYFDKLTQNQRQVYANEIATVMSIQDSTSFNQDPDVKKWLSEPASLGGGEKFRNASFPVQKQAYADALAKKKTSAMDATISPTEGEDDTGAGGGGPTASPLDDIVKKLRDVRKATQELTVGWDASGKALKKLSKETLAFGGLAQKLRKQGANQNTIDFITGLSPEDYKKYKGMFKDFKTLQTALNNIALGDYYNDQEKVVAQSENQTKAFKKLVAAGMPVADAYEAIKDDALAAAVASEKTNKSLTSIVSSRAKAIAAQFKNAMAIGNYTDAFDPGYNAAMKYFEIQEKIIRLGKKGEIDKQKLIVNNAEKQIKIAQRVQAANNYQIDRYEDGLKTIDDKAEEIRDKYNKQFEALDKIQKVNDIIARQERDRLSVSQALAEGDIYAAARAVQEARAAEAQTALDQQRQGMEASRDAQINKLTSGGLTRDQLEQKIKTLKEQNYRIEQDTIAPLQEQARLAQVRLDIIEEDVQQQLEGLRIAGLTKDEWETQRTKIEAAEFATGKYNDMIARSKTAAEQLSSTWDEILKKMNEYNSNQNLTTSSSSSDDTDPGKDDTDPGKDDTKKPKSKNPTPPPKTKYFPTPAPNLKGVNMSMGVMGSKGPTLAPVKSAASFAAASKINVLPGITSKYGVYRANGGMIQKFASGGFAFGTDTVPAMLTPGEFIVSKFAVDKFGVDNLRAINKGENPMSSSVYNYSLSINVKSDANPNEIANTVMMKIKQIDSQRIRGSRI